MGVWGDGASAAGAPATGPRWVSTAYFTPLEPRPPRRSGPLALRGGDGASTTALQPPPLLLTTLPAPARGRTVRLPRRAGAGRACVPCSRSAGGATDGAKRTGGNRPGCRGSGSGCSVCRATPERPLARVTDQQQQGKHDHAGQGQSRHRRQVRGDGELVARRARVPAAVPAPRRPRCPPSRVPEASGVIVAV